MSWGTAIWLPVRDRGLLVPTLAKRRGRRDRAVQRSLDRLAAAGWVVPRDGKRSKGGPGNVTVWVMAVPVAEAARLVAAVGLTSPQTIERVGRCWENDPGLVERRTAGGSASPDAGRGAFAEALRNHFDEYGRSI